MVGPGRRWPLATDGSAILLFLHCTRDVVIGDLPRQPATASENEAGDRNYVWEARRYSMRSSDKPFFMLGIKDMLTGKNKHALYYSKHILFKSITPTWKNPNLLLHTMISCLGKINH
jgi:hypothetical protein